MKRVIVFVVLMLTIAYSGAPEKTAGTLAGRWCVGDNGLILTFTGKDTMSVASLTDSTTKGSGTYQKDDSTFSATIMNSDMVMKMKYRYRWKAKESIEAQAIIFTVNNDTVDSPKEWTTMTRCANPTLEQKKVPAAQKGTESKNATK
jgi:hypothetical protein